MFLAPIGSMERSYLRAEFLCCAFQGYRFNFDILDRKGSSGWDLARKLICRRNSVNRGRLSAGDALRHRFFLPEF